MKYQILQYFEWADIVIKSAAVADYKPKSIVAGKIKKSAGNMTIETEKTVDILEYLGKNKSNYKLVGFALETENEIDYAKGKIEKKNLDMIVVNNPKVDGAGFKTDTNVITIIDNKYQKKQIQILIIFRIYSLFLLKFFVYGLLSKIEAVKKLKHINKNYTQ